MIEKFIKEKVEQVLYSPSLCNKIVAATRGTVLKDGCHKMEVKLCIPKIKKRVNLEEANASGNRRKENTTAAFPSFVCFLRQGYAMCLRLALNSLCVLGWP